MQNAEGAILGPFDCWLAMRGLKTMALRMRRQAASAAIIARWLARHPLVKKVNYPGLPAHQGHDIHVAQASAGGSLLSFETGRCGACCSRATVSAGWCMMTQHVLQQVEHSLFDGICSNSALLSVHSAEHVLLGKAVWKVTEPGCALSHAIVLSFRNWPVSLSHPINLACSTEASRTIAEEAQLFKITVSFGSVSSLISLPCYMSHASIPADVRAARGLPDDLVRISVGIEDPEDLLEGEHT